MTPARILGYARVSSIAQSDGSSLGDQEEVIRRHAKNAHDSNVVQMFVESESAVHEKIERREQIRSLMSQVRRGDLIVCDKIDRWSRDPEFTYASVREILAVGASIYFIGDACDPSTAEGDTAMGFRILYAREEHKRIKLRMVGTRRLLRDRGFYVEGLPPWGYRRQAAKGPEKNVLRVVEDDAAQVRRAFALAIAGQSLSEIAEAFGQKIDRVKDALHNRAYLGQVKNTAGEWIAGKHPPIIDADTFTKAQAAIAGRRHGFRPGADSETSTWILREVAGCALCDATMSAAYAGPREARRYYYRCFARCTTSYVNVVAVETAVAPLILARLEELRIELGREPPPMKATTPKRDDRRRKLEARRERLLEQHADGHLTREALREKIAKLDSDLLALDGQEQRAHKPSPLADVKVRRSVLTVVANLRRAWTEASPLEKRAIVGALAISCGMQAGKAPVMAWRTAEDLAST